MRILVSLIFISLAMQINSRCNFCNTTSLYGCISSDQFIPCNANGEFDLTAIGTCTTGMVCDQNLGVGTPCGVGIVESCQTPHLTFLTSNTTANNTTPLSSFNVYTFCAAKAQGSYAHPSYTTCANYVRCFSNGTMIGSDKYICEGTTLFNPATQYCESGYTCAG